MSDTLKAPDEVIMAKEERLKVPLRIQKNLKKVKKSKGGPIPKILQNKNRKKTTKKGLGVGAALRGWGAVRTG
jgi:hypothetical protein